MAEIHCPNCGKTNPIEANYCRSCGKPLSGITTTDNISETEASSIDEEIPVFTPPIVSSVRDFDGPACEFHHNSPAVCQCDRCGKALCSDCASAFSGYAECFDLQHICYDCLSEMVGEDLAQWKKQRSQIIRLIVLTVVGMYIGADLFQQAGATDGWIVFGALLFGSFWTWIKIGFSAWWNGPNHEIARLVGSLIGSAITAPFHTVVKIFQGVIYLFNTINVIQQDTDCLAEIHSYMEYTRALDASGNISLDQLISDNSGLADNPYAQIAQKQGVQAAEQRATGFAGTIASNGEIIRGFDAI